MSADRHLADGMLVVLARRGDRAIPARAATHLSRCARCRAVLADFRLLSEHVRAGAQAPAPTALAGVFALAEPRPPAARVAARFPFARLLSDTGPVAQAAGIRAPESPRAQVWRIPGADVDVRVEPVGLGSPGRLHGQVFPHSAAPARVADGSVWLLQRGRRPAWTIVVESGEFELPAPTHRRWALWLEWCGVRARLESP